jgi:FAD/FMN-containing dehydrogenase
MFDAVYPAGLQWYWKSDFIDSLPEEAIALYVSHAADMPTPLSVILFHPIDGAAGRVPPEATPWTYRHAKWATVIGAVSDNPADNERMIAWARDYWAALHPYSAGGAYVNMMMDEADEGADRVRASYRDNYDRLAAIKARYDPANLFRVNQNIRPAAASAR